MKALKEIASVNNAEVVLEAEWSNHRVHQQRMRWAEMGKLAGERIEAMQKQGKLAQLFTEQNDKARECVA